MGIYWMNSSSRKYIIDYDLYQQKGGSISDPKPVINTIFPPSLNSNIWIKKKEGNKVFRGTVLEYIWNKTAAVIKINNLDKGEEYNEISLKDYDRFQNGKNHMLVLPTHLWNYEEKEAFFLKKKKKKKKKK